MTNRKSLCGLSNGTIPITLSDFEGHFNRLKTFQLSYLGQIAHANYEIHVNRKSISPVISAVISKLEDFSRFQAVLCTVNVAIFWKWRNTKTLVLITYY